MKKLLLPCLVAALAATTSPAAPADDISAAAKKLSDASGYSWSATTEMVNSQFTSGPTSGKTEKGGFTVVTRSFNGNDMVSVSKGEQFVMQNQEGAWVTREELMAQFGGGAGGGGGANRGGAAGGAGGGGGAGRGRGGFGLGGGQNNPAEDVTALVAQSKNLKAADGAITGDLAAEALAQRLSFGGRGGQAPAAPANATGTVKFWLKDGAIAKYQIHVKGTIEGRNGPQDVDRTTTTEIKDIGATKVTVPDDAKKKLGL